MVPSNGQELSGRLGPTEQRRHGLKAITLGTQQALIAAGVPVLWKSDSQIPHWYSGGGSWQAKGKVPWLAEKRRAMTPAEGIGWLAAKCDASGGSLGCNEATDAAKCVLLRRPQSPDAAKCVLQQTPVPHQEQTRAT